MKWSGPKNRHEVPGDPGFFTRLWWAIEDYVNPSDRATLGLVIFALVLLWLIIAYTVPGPH